LNQILWWFPAGGFSEKHIILKKEVIREKFFSLIACLSLFEQLLLVK